MNYIVAFWSFGFLMIMHFIADFGTPRRGWGVKSWKDLFLYYQIKKHGWTNKAINETIKARLVLITSEWFLSLNISHWLWDRSRFRRHGRHVSVVYGQDLVNMGWINKIHEKDIIKDEQLIVVGWWFFRWLAVDQIFHTLANMLLAIWLGGMF